MGIMKTAACVAHPLFLLLQIPEYVRTYAEGTGKSDLSLPARQAQLVDALRHQHIRLNSQQSRACVGPVAFMKRYIADLLSASSTPVLKRQISGNPFHH